MEQVLGLHADGSVLFPCEVQQFCLTVTCVGHSVVTVASSYLWFSCPLVNSFNTKMNVSYVLRFIPYLTENSVCFFRKISQVMYRETMFFVIIRNT